MLDHRGDDLRLGRCGLVGIGDDGGVAALGEGHLGAGRELGEERVAEVVDDKSDQPDVGPAEVGGRAVVDIVQLVHRPLDELAGRGTNQGLFCSTFDTVDFETPATLATSTIVGRLCITSSRGSARPDNA